MLCQEEEASSRLHPLMSIYRTRKPSKVVHPHIAMAFIRSHSCGILWVPLMRQCTVCMSHCLSVTQNGTNKVGDLVDLANDIIISLSSDDMVVKSRVGWPKE